MKRRLTIGLLLLALLTALATTAAAGSIKLIPGGNTVGLQLDVQGVTIAQTTPECRAALCEGDQIIAINNETIESADEIQQLLGQAEGDVTVRLVRGGKPMQLLAPRTADGKLGILVREHVAGIGTVTYVDPQTGGFGCLGHGVADQDTGALLPITGGSVLPAQIVSVEKGKAGQPGKLNGAATSLEPVGTVEKNSSHGLFGSLRHSANTGALAIAAASQIQPGPAVILSNVSGDRVQEYDVEILKIYPTETQSGRNLLLQVTDPELLAQTGGIVQGMSGSPIIQNGRLVGAVTHVLVSDPTTGYGIFIKNMLDAAS